MFSGPRGQTACARLASLVHPSPCSQRHVLGFRSPSPASTGPPTYNGRSIRWMSVSSQPLEAGTLEAGTADAPLETKPPGVRETLRMWEAENNRPADVYLREAMVPGRMPNFLAKSEPLASHREVRDPDAGRDQHFDEDGGMSHEVEATIELRPGDLVELRSSDSRIPLLAIIIGRFGLYHFFYTNSGQLTADVSIRSHFNVANFCSPAELGSLSDFINNHIHDDVEPSDLLKEQPPRELGTKLLKRMARFHDQSLQFYQDNISSFPRLALRLGDPVRYKYMSLSEIAGAILPAKARATNGKFPPRALYAVHTALLNDDSAPVRLTNLWHNGQDYLYEICPSISTDVVRSIEEQVRAAQEAMGRVSTLDPAKVLLNESPLLQFIVKAQTAISVSRSRREWSPHGMLGTSFNNVAIDLKWTENDLCFLRFMELWASYNQFPRGSRLHSIGSSLLKFVGMYKSADTLSASVGWTFLQEVGWIPPWEIQARYELRFPGSEIRREGGYSRPVPNSGPSILRPDIAASNRRDWGQLRAYCIDEPSTVLIDDAISVEPTDNPDEHWVHVHVADPAAFLKPTEDLVEATSIIPENLYLPGYYESMFPPAIAHEVDIMNRFSLAPGRPCLTFSARVNGLGALLDYKVEPGVLNNVVYLSSDTVKSVCPEPAPAYKPQTVLTVGEPPSQSGIVPNRPMTGVDELTESDKKDLHTLDRLAASLRNVRVSNGLRPVRLSTPTARVSLDSVSRSMAHGNSPTVWDGDPYIRVGYSDSTSCNLVQYTMELAGEVAARWCHDRKIPIPFRVQGAAGRNPDKLRELATEVYKILEEGAAMPVALWQAFSFESGPVRLSIEPGPVFAMGFDMYTKATSPLRRFTDLLVHWQIHGALAEERRRGKSLVGTTDFALPMLPFSRARLRSMLDAILMRERTAKRLSNVSGRRQWILQALLRAWRFGEAAIPQTFRFEVRDVYVSSAYGVLDWFDQAAVLDVDGVQGVSRMQDIRIGDVFEVELHDVNVHSQYIFVKAIRRLQTVARTIGQ